MPQPSPAWLRGYIPLVLLQMPPPPGSPPSIPSHRWLFSLALRISCSTSLRLLLKLDYFLGELILCPVGRCKETGLSLIDVASFTVWAETLYMLEALDMFAEWSQSWGRLESTQTCDWYHPSAWWVSYSLRNTSRTLVLYPLNTNLSLLLPRKFSAPLAGGPLLPGAGVCVCGGWGRWGSVYQQRSEISLLLLYLFIVYPSAKQTSWCFFS